MAEEKGRLTIERYFTKGLEGSVYDSFEMEKCDVDIVDDNNKLLFVQKGVEFPKTWSPLARKITASKYFFGEQETPERESSIKQLVGRVSDTIYDWAVKDNYFSSQEEARVFADEFAYLAMDQRMSPNSPVWFNVGVHKIVEPIKKEPKEAYIIRDGRVRKMPLGKEREYPQTSACFIQSVDDTMESIMDLAKNEALLFKYGSGTGTNLSTLRSSREKLSSGGKPSGPLAYWAFYDKVAGIVKSGGKTRRAAKMDILNDWHPDIMEFITSKMEQEKLLHILIDAGVDKMVAQEAVNYQNTNISVRVSDDFMRAVENDEEWQTIPVHNKELVDKMPKYRAKDLLRKITEATHFCGDPGIQFDDTINLWHTCPNSGRINASNPCAEYLNIDDSACNLLSQNLMKFVRFNRSGSDGRISAEFDTREFGYAIRTAAIAQDLFVDNSSSPTKKIAANSRKFRPLGMGYANLGSLVMSLGLPYDSDEARAVASAITALQTGKVYETSTEMAEKFGTFEEFEKNKKPMLNVMKMHRDALSGINREKLPKGLENILDEAEKTWDNVIGRGEKYGFRNSQASVLAPTGTIGFFMDCNTKGVEPELGIVQTKLLSDGGTLRLVNRTVDEVLPKLDYDEKQTSEIISYIDKEETIEGAPHIKEEHLPIFDCANKPKGSTRTISSQGHLKMVAAVQPFISGGVSKTVNLPEETTEEEIEKVYGDAWKMGVKAVALYRDGSKRYQPMSFSKKGGLEKLAEPVRRKLPITRDGKIHKFDIAGHEGYITIGKYDDGTPGEIFINMSKEGSTIGGLSDAFATSVSLNLQYGVSLRKLVDKFKNQTFEPRGLVFEGDPDIHEARSIVDYVFNFMEKEFLKGKEEKEKKKIEEPILTNSLGNDLEGVESFCGVCGGPMELRGHCNFVCPKCDWVDPKGCGE